MVLLMSVNPGFGGQKFIDSSLDKLRQARRMIDASGRDIRLEIDGGVKAGNIGEIAAAGADTFVAGSAIFGSDDYAATIAENEIGDLLRAGSDRYEFAAWRRKQQSSCRWQTRVPVLRELSERARPSPVNSRRGDSVPGG